MEVKEELKNTSIQITCLDEDGNVLKRVTSGDSGEVEEPDNDDSGSTQNGGENSGSQAGGENTGGNSGGGSDNGGNSGGDDNGGGGSGEGPDIN